MSYSGFWREPNRKYYKHGFIQVLEYIKENSEKFPEIKIEQINKTTEDKFPF
jgi:hypothetical protein